MVDWIDRVVRMYEILMENIQERALMGDILSNDKEVFIICVFDRIKKYIFLQN